MSNISVQASDWMSRLMTMDDVQAPVAKPLDYLKWPEDINDVTCINFPSSLLPKIRESFINGESKVDPMTTITSAGFMQRFMWNGCLFTIGCTFFDSVQDITLDEWCV